MPPPFAPSVELLQWAKEEGLYPNQSDKTDNIYHTITRHSAWITSTWIQDGLRDVLQYGLVSEVLDPAL